MSCRQVTQLPDRHPLDEPVRARCVVPLRSVEAHEFGENVVSPDDHRVVVDGTQGLPVAAMTTIEALTENFVLHFAHCNLRLTSSDGRGSADSALLFTEITNNRGDLLRSTTDSWMLSGGG